MKAFSLIELLIVITIVGVIAAIAAPAYKQYSTKAKMSAIVRLAEDFTQQSLNFYNRNDYWPTAGMLGLNNITNSTAVASPETVSPYLLNLNVSAQLAYPNCAVGVVYGDFNMTALGFPAGTTGSFSCFFFPYHKSYITDCYYALFDPDSGQYIQIPYIPTWAGCTSANCSTPNPYYRIKDGGDGHIGFTNATCFE